MRVLAEQNRAFGYAIAASAALHAFLLLNLPAWREPAPAPPEPPLVAHLVEPAAPAPPAPAPPPAAPAPPPVAQRPEPPKPASRPPAPTPKRKRSVQSKPLARPAPSAPPSVTPPPEQRVEDAAKEAAPESSAPAPATGSLPPAAAPAAPTGPALASSAQPDPETERERFRQALIQRAEQIKRYPRRAVDEGWSGQVTVRIEMAEDGSVASVRVKSSSGNSELDAVAKEMFGKAAAQVGVPPALRGKAFAVEVPAIYKFTD